MKKSIITSVLAQHQQDIIKGHYDAPIDLQFLDEDKQGGCTTACWLWSGYSHQIRIFDGLVGVPRKGAKNLPLFVKTVKHHEDAHAKLTGRRFIRNLQPGVRAPKPTLRSLGKHIRDLGVSHQLCNLGEDVWIEQCWREDYTVRWNWWKWQDFKCEADFADRKPDSEEHAFDILLDLKVADRNRKLLQAYLGQKGLSTRPKGGRRNSEKRRAVWAYYNEFTRATDSWEVATIAKAFADQFPECVSLEHLILPGVTTLQGAIDGSPATDLVGEATTHTGALDAPDDDNPEIKDDPTGNFKKVPVNGWFPGCGNNAAAALRKALAGGVAPTQRTSSPTIHLDVGDWVSRAPDAYRKTAPAPVGKSQKVVVIYDVSDSMEGDYHEAGIVFLDALKTLHDEGTINLSIIFASDNGAWRWDGGAFQHIELCYITTDGCSPLNIGFQRALDDELISGETICIGYTDGAIVIRGDHRKEYNKLGCRPIGAFVSTDIQRLNHPTMRRAFDVFAARASVDSLANWLGQEIKNTRQAQGI